MEPQENRQARLLRMLTPQKTAVLLLAHGSPDTLDNIPEFLSRVTRGRPVPFETIEEVKHRYSLIGHSPLTHWTMKQRDLLARELGLPVYVGMRNWKPFIADALHDMHADAIDHAIAICLAPQNSRTSVGLYRADLNTGRHATFCIDFVECWHNHPRLIQAFAERLRAGWNLACREWGVRVPVIFTAHSVPQRTIAEGDSYEAQAKETAALVAAELSLAAEDWRFAFQSQGMSGGPWLGPTLEDTMVSLKQQGHGAAFIQPVGFLCDHVEVLYDIDIGLKRFAEQHAMRLWRAESLNDSPLLTAALADLVRSRLKL
jgi:protoporphyrin/coproporphyrin ferrochelatase